MNASGIRSPAQAKILIPRPHRVTQLSSRDIADQQLDPLGGTTTRPAYEAETLAQRLETLRAAFASMLPDRLRAIAASYEIALHGSLDDETLHGLCRLAHGLKGAAATYGYTALREATSHLEDGVLALLDVSYEQREPAKPVIAVLLKALMDAPCRADETHGFALISSHAETVEEHARAEKCVFLLEDEQSLRDLVSEQLKHYGYGVRSFAEPASFIEAVSKGRPDALIVDIVLDGSDMTGLDVLNILDKSMGALPPVIVATFRTDLDARVGAVRAGVAAYLTKPIDITDLVATLDRLTLAETIEPYRVLIVDDDAATGNYHGELLRSAKIETRIVESPGAVMEQLTEFRPDLLLLDLHMPNISGTDLAAVVRQQPSFSSLPIVFLSSELDPTRQLATIVGGADDFLEKPVLADTLIASITARSQRARLLRSMTIQDPMTKLLNHTATKEQLTAELARGKRHATATVFALIDIDMFKNVNDTYGHPVGDAVIWGLARLLRQRLRQSDVVGRYGGEEFAVIMPETSLDRALGVLDDLRERFAKLEFLAGDSRFTMTFSGGAALAGPTEQPADVLRAADEALYRAKRLGRNMICHGEAGTGGPQTAG